jgi:hypothetical protein
MPDLPCRTAAVLLCYSVDTLLEEPLHLWAVDHR